jgi:hypothetical protein
VETEAAAQHGTAQLLTYLGVGVTSSSSSSLPNPTLVAFFFFFTTFVDATFANFTSCGWWTSIDIKSLGGGVFNGVDFTYQTRKMLEKATQGF